eukprot:7898822-Pyramimonas_sp.AAC.1
MSVGGGTRTRTLTSSSGTPSSGTLHPTKEPLVFVVASLPMSGNARGVALTCIVGDAGEVALLLGGSCDE